MTSPQTVGRSDRVGRAAGPAMERLLLTAEEVAEALHIGRTRVFTLIAAKEIASVKIGNLRRIPVDSVREYAARLIQMEREAG